MNIDRKEALVALRAFDGLRHRLKSLGENPSMEQLRHIDELAHAYAGLLIKKGVSFESTMDYSSSVARRLDAAVASLEGIFDFLKSKKKEEPSKKETTEKTKDEAHYQSILKGSSDRELTYSSVSIDGKYGGALTPVKGGLKAPEDLIDGLKKELDAYKALYSDYKKAMGPFIKWCDDSNSRVEKFFYGTGNIFNDDYDPEKFAELVKKIDSARVPPPRKKMRINGKLKFIHLDLLIDNWEKDYDKLPTGSVKIDAITKKEFIEELVDLAKSYLELSVKIVDDREDLLDGLKGPLIGGDDPPYRSHEVFNIIEENLKKGEFDWEAHSMFWACEPADMLEKMAYAKFMAIAELIDRALK